MRLFYDQMELKHADSLAEKGYTEEEIELHRSIFGNVFTFEGARDEMGEEHFVEVFNSYMSKRRNDGYPFAKVRLEIWEDGIHAISYIWKLRRDRLVAPNKEYWKRIKKNLRKIGLSKIQVRIMLDWAMDKFGFYVSEPWEKYKMTKKEFKKAWNSAIRIIERKYTAHVGPWHVISFSALVEGVSRPCLVRMHMY